jgi:hypothetical protein
MSGPDPFSSFLKLADSLGELEVTLGAASRPVIASIRSKLIEAATARSRGDVAAGVASLHQAMEQLAGLAATLDPAEGAMMGLIAQRLTGALVQGDRESAKESVNFIRHRAGDPKDDPDTDW